MHLRTYREENRSRHLDRIGQHWSVDLVTVTAASILMLGNQLAGETRCILDNDGPDAIALDPVQQGGEAGADLNRVRAADCGIVELADQGEACPLGVTLDGGPLSLVASPCRRRRWPPRRSAGRPQP